MSSNPNPTASIIIIIIFFCLYHKKEENPILSFSLCHAVLASILTGGSAAGAGSSSPSRQLSGRLPQFLIPNAQAFSFIYFPYP